MVELLVIACYWKHMVRHMVRVGVGEAQSGGRLYSDGWLQERCGQAHH